MGHDRATLLLAKGQRPIQQQPRFAGPTKALLRRGSYPACPTPPTALVI